MSNPKHSEEVPVWRGPGSLRVGVYVQGWVCHCGRVASLCGRVSVSGPVWLHIWSWLLAGVCASLQRAWYCKSWLLSLCKQDINAESLYVAIPKVTVTVGAGFKSQREVFAFPPKYQSSWHCYRAEVNQAFDLIPETAKERSMGNILNALKRPGSAFCKLFCFIRWETAPFF